MGKMKYTTKEVLDLLKITEGTIRNYERKGLINTDRKDNNYRDYDYRTLNRIVSIRRLRNYGFSIDNIATLINSDLDTAINLLTTKKEESVKELEKLTNNIYNLNLDLDRLELIKRYDDSYKIVSKPKVKFIEYTKSSNIDFDNYASLAKFNELDSVIHPLLGYIINDEELDTTNKLCLYNISKVTDSDIGFKGFSTFINKAKAYASSIGYHLVDDVLAIKLYTLIENNHQVDYWDMYYPIEKGSIK